MKTGLALSGGGFRATVFHFGVLARLAKEDHLENITYLSSVSGGSLAVGLIMAQNNFIWPGSQQYLDDTLPKLRIQITTNGLQKPLIFRQLRRLFTIFDTRADDVAALLQERWGITSNLNKLPETPRWMINATCFETGKNWRFERFRMGDYQFGYSYDTDFPLSQAMAASAALPALIGPLVFNTAGRSWFEYVDRVEESETPATQEDRKTRSITPEYDHLHLWDGGVYDNLGLEGLHDFREGWPAMDFLIVSDASGIFKSAVYTSEASALLRMATGIMKNQIRALQSRTVLERILDHGNKDRGSYLRTGNYAERILKSAWREDILTGAKTIDDIRQLSAGSLSKEQAEYCANMPTHIDNMTEKDYDMLFQHGFEVANVIMHAYNPDLFGFVSYKSMG
jgi:NTE family protein